MGSSKNCFAKLAGAGAPASRKQTEAEGFFSEQMRVSSFEPFSFVDGQQSISEFTLPDNELNNAVS